MSNQRIKEKMLTHELGIKTVSFRSKALLMIPMLGGTVDCLDVVSLLFVSSECLFFLKGFSKWCW